MHALSEEHNSRGNTLLREKMNREFEEAKAQLLKSRRAVRVLTGADAEQVRL